MVTAGSGLEVHLRIGHHCLRHRPMAGTAFLGVGSAYGEWHSSKHLRTAARPVFADECWIASLPFALLAPVLLRGLRATCKIHLQAAGPRMFAVVFSIAKGVFRPRSRSSCAHRFFLVMSRVGHLIGHNPASAQLAVPQSIFAPSFATCAAGSWLAQLVFARSVFSHGFLRSAPNTAAGSWLTQHVPPQDSLTRESSCAQPAADW